METRLIEQCILDMASARGADKTICPSEVARALFPADWRSHMEEVRAAAFGLQAENKVLVTQKGEPVTEGNLKGPVRIRIKS